VAIVEADTRTGQLKDAESAAFYRTATGRLKSVPGVTAVSGAIVVPLSMDSIVNSLLVDRGDKEQNVTVNTNWVLPGYFRTMGIALREGRDFTEADRQTKSRAAIVNETFARRLFPNQSAIGKRVRRPAENPEPWAEIVAVAADSRYLTLGEETRPQIYWPFGPNAGNIKLHVRTEGDAAALARSLPAILNAVDARVPTRSQPLSSVMAIALFPARAAALLLGALGMVGWALTIAGIYGVVSFTLAQRVPEIGLRMALGAAPFSVMRLLIRDGLAITAVGLGIGLILAGLATPLLATFLSGVPPRDAGSFVLTALVLIGTALVASYGPARRGMRLSPMDALRND
jgi:putative ABC transport system permease protein